MDRPRTSNGVEISDELTAYRGDVLTALRRAGEAGAGLKEAEVAKEIGLSVAAAAELLRRLEVEGQVRRRPTGGWKRRA
jgi:predicted transcriptional regulator